MQCMQLKWNYNQEVKKKKKKKNKKIRQHKQAKQKGKGKKEQRHTTHPIGTIQIYGPAIVAYRILGDENLYKGKNPMSESLLSMTNYLTNLQQYQIGTRFTSIRLFCRLCGYKFSSLQHLHEYFNNVSFGILQCGLHYCDNSKLYEEYESVKFSMLVQQAPKTYLHHLRYISMPLNYESE
eukprot:TRINITY_DN5706_c0_g1_i2.p4 TRINITY_DN5706_c0_g1~~TRINITY_DN5706_c0_g1_i2.p4  ORF type:complete len:180 (+),score=1.12 TRINITY_DN5706_c0_g1_i2:934-1473(+)